MEVLKREFVYDNLDLPDIPGKSVEEILDYYASFYPELTQSIVEGPETKDGALVYEFRRAVGTKGMISVKDLLAGDLPAFSWTAPAPEDLKVMDKVGTILCSPESGAAVLPPSDVQGLI